MRQFSGNMPYTHALISKHMVDNRSFFSSKGIIQQAPLYLYPEKVINDKSTCNGTEQLFTNGEPTDRKPNISKAVFDTLAASYGTQPTPEDILYYIYAVMYSSTYREKYSEFLRIDFPRIPFTNKLEVFKRMATLGRQLADLHLLKSTVLNTPVAKYEGGGDNDRIKKPVYDKDEERVYINADKYFTGIKPEVWEYQVGGYQVLSKYLKDRKGRIMDDPRHYCRVVTALEKTIDLQKQIDTIYPKVEKSILLIDKW